MEKRGVVLESRLEFRPLTATELTEELLLEIGKLHMEYLKDSEDPTLTTENLFRVIEDFLTNEGSVFQYWLLLDASKMVGFAVTDFVLGLEGAELNIAQAYIAPGFRTASTQKLTVAAFEKFAKGHNCVYLTSATRRDPVLAYIRWMGRAGFKKRMVVMEKDLREDSHG